MPSKLTADLKPEERLIVALDLDTQEEVLEITRALSGLVNFYKVGWQLFLREGWDLVGQLLSDGHYVFLDLKIHDIEETVRAAIKNMSSKYYGKLELLTIHGNGPTVTAAKEGRNGNDKPLVLMLTALSSWDEWDLKDFLATSSDVNIDRYSELLAEKALDAGAEGLIASGESVRTLREKFADREFLIVAPGIRMEGTSTHEHKRSLTPLQAIIYGADYLVVGRPITQSDEPRAVAEQIIGEIDRALRQLGYAEKVPTPDDHKEKFDAFQKSVIGGA